MSSPLNKSAKQKKNKNNVAEKFVNFWKKRGIVREIAFKHWFR